MEDLAPCTFSENSVLYCIVLYKRFLTWPK